MASKKYLYVCRRLAILLTIVMILTICLIYDRKVYAASGSCEAVSGSNEDYNDYGTSSKVITSYLCPVDDGNLMRVQSLTVAKGENPILQVQYYDADYNYISTKMITCDLPKFGGFSATDNAFYVLSGQNNFEEDNTLEVYRVTKYDKEWNRLSSVGLYGANTCSPFQSGTARFDYDDKYLVIRTCHTMYTTSDGLNHQANVTFIVDTETMEITDSYYSIMNVGVGYCSHSFNQFVKFDNSKVVGVDHGDAYPRTVEIFKSRSNTAGKFSGSHDHISLFDISGDIGKNYTGVSVGGFEISSSKYIVVGNSVDQQDADNSKTRNVFVSVIPRDFTNDSEEAEKRFITEYPEGEQSARNPILVKISNERFLVLWSVTNSSSEKDKDTIYYVELDSDGNTLGELHAMKGHLSDCQPVLVDGKIIWYTWGNNLLTFYEISSDDISNTSEIVIKEGHIIPETAEADPGTGTVSYECERCGETLSFTVPGTWTTYWRKGEGYYMEYIAPNVEVGDVISLWHYTTGDYDTFIFQYEISDPDKCVFERNSLGGKFTMLKPGTVTVSVWPKYNTSLKTTKTFNIAGEPQNSETENDETTGDIDGDGEITPKDVTLLRRYLAGGWNVSIIEANADADGDGSISPKDVTILRRYLAGGWGVTIGKII